MSVVLGSSAVLFLTNFCGSEKGGRAGQGRVIHLPHFSACVVTLAYDVELPGLEFLLNTPRSCLIFGYVITSAPRSQYCPCGVSPNNKNELILIDRGVFASRFLKLVYNASC